MSRLSFHWFCRRQTLQRLRFEIHMNGNDCEIQTNGNRWGNRWEIVNEFIDNILHKDFYQQICDRLTTDTYKVTFRSTTQRIPEEGSIDETCKYCGFLECTDEHFEMHFLEVLAASHEWMSLGGDLYMSRVVTRPTPRKPTKHQFLVQVRSGLKSYSRVTAVNDRENRLVSFTVPQKLVQQFLPLSEPSTLSSWILRSLLKKKCDWEVVRKRLPPSLCKYYCIEDLEKGSYLTQNCLGLLFDSDDGEDL